MTENLADHIRKSVPVRFHGTCEFCQQILDVRAEGVHQYTKGWVKIRSGGGGHGISLPQRENKWAHGYCVDREVAGHSSQAGLFR